MTPCKAILVLIVAVLLHTDVGVALRSERVRRHKKFRGVKGEKVVREYVVEVKPGVDLDFVSKSLCDRSGSKRLKTFRLGSKYRGFVVRVPEGSEDQALEDIMNNPNVSIALENGIFKGQGHGSIPWAMDRSDQVNLPENSQYMPRATGKGTCIFVMDSGIRGDHVDFIGRLGRPGWTAFGPNDDPYNDWNGHGTMMASIAGGNVYGISKEATIYSVKTADSNTLSSWGDVITALSWIAAHPCPKKIASMSMSAGKVQEFNDRFDAIITEGKFVAITSASNSGATLDACDMSPASAAKIWTAGGSNAYDYMYLHSRTGPCVDIFAPGMETSTATRDSSTSVNLGRGYGTSLSAAAAAGAAAVIMESVSVAALNANPDIVKQIMLDTATDNRMILWPGSLPGTTRKVIYTGSLYGQSS